MQPYCCPVCNGRGTVAHFFYGGGLQTWVGEPPQIPCRSCNGTGIVWGGDAPPLGTPFANPFTNPFTPSTATTIVTSTPNTSVSFTSLQGVVPAGRRESSVDPRYAHSGG